jgi:hypothetical protein
VRKSTSRPFAPAIHTVDCCDQARKRPLRVEYSRLEGLLDDARLGVEGALPDAECGAQVCRCDVRRKRSVAEKADPSQHVDDPPRPGSRLSGSEWARAENCPEVPSVLSARPPQPHGSGTVTDQKSRSTASRRISTGKRARRAWVNSASRSVRIPWFRSRETSAVAFCDGVSGVCTSSS